MHIGDIVIADHPDSRTSALVRTYGVVHKIAKSGMVTIEMADGSKIERQSNSIAVYVQPPPNWQELYQRQMVLYQPRKRMSFGKTAGK